MKIEKDQVAVVTGGASGIGLAMARRFAREGMTVVLADVERGALDRTVDELRASGEYVKLFDPAYAFRASYARDRVRRRLLPAGVRLQLPFESDRMIGRRLEPGSRLALAIAINKRADQQVIRSLNLLKDQDETTEMEEANLLTNHGWLLVRQGKVKEATEPVSRAIARYESSGGPDNPKLVKVLQVHAEILRKTRKPIEAEASLQRALTINRAAFGPDDPENGKILAQYATVLKMLDRKDEAHAMTEQASRIRESHRATRAAFQSVVSVEELRTAP